MKPLVVRFARINWLLMVIVALGAVLRFWGINYGLPYTYGPDEPTYLTLALQILKTGDLNPHWWYYPSLLFYLNAAALWLLFVVGRILGWITFAGPGDFPLPEVVTMGVGRLALPAEFLVARGLTAFFSAGAIVLVYLICRQLHPARWVGNLAALLFAVSPTVIGLSHRVGPDIFAMFFSLVSFLFAMKIVDEPRLRNYVFAGMGAGLAIASKYNAGMILIALVAAHFVRFGLPGWRRKELYIGLGAAFGFFVLATPFAVLDFTNFWDGVRFQAFSYASEGHAGQEGGALTWYVSYLWGAEGWIALCGAVSAVLVLLNRSRKEWVLLSFPLTYFVFVSLLLVRNDRTILLIVPFLALLAAKFVGDAFDWLSQRIQRPRAVALATVAVIVFFVSAPLQSAAAANAQLTQADGREAARVWIDQHLPAGSRVAVEAYAPYVDTDRFAVHGEFSMIDRTPEWYVQDGYEYLVFSYGAFGRYYEAPALYPAQLARYEDFFSTFPELVRFNENGYLIRIFKTNVANLPSRRVAARFGIYAPMIELVGFDANNWQPGKANLTFAWLALESRREPVQLTAALLDRNDHEIARASGDLFSSTDSTGHWPSGVRRVPWGFAVPATADPGLYRVELELNAEGIGRLPRLNKDNTQLSDKLFLGPFKLPPTPPAADELSRAHTSGVGFGNAFALASYQAAETVRAGDSITVTFYWKSLAKTDKDYTFFVHLIDSKGMVRAQIDAQPRSGAYPTSLWDAGEVIRDDYALQLPLDLTPSSYRIEVGAYEYPSLTRLQLDDGQGKPLGDHLVLDRPLSVQ